MRPPVPAISVAGIGGPKSPVPICSVPSLLATSKNRLLALSVPISVRLLWSTRVRSPPPVTEKPPAKPMALLVPRRLVVPATPPLLSSDWAVMVLVDASLTGPADVISMALPVCPSAALPVSAMPPVPAVRSIVAAVSEPPAVIISAAESLIVASVTAVAVPSIVRLVLSASTKLAAVILPSVVIALAVLSSVHAPPVPVRLLTVTAPPDCVMAPVASSRSVVAMPVRSSGAPMSTEAADAAGVVASAGTLVKPPTSSVPLLVWTIDSNVASTRGPSPPSMLAAIAENGASSTVPAFVVIELSAFATT